LKKLYNLASSIMFEISKRALNIQRKIVNSNLYAMTSFNEATSTDFQAEVNLTKILKKLGKTLELLQS